jgi:hypothetical protein
LELLIFVSTQAPPQATSYGGHSHEPPTHEAPVAHVFPHAPQFIGSVLYSTQSGPHCSCEGRQKPDGASVAPPSGTGGATGVHAGSWPPQAVDRAHA